MRKQRLASDPSRRKEQLQEIRVRGSPVELVIQVGKSTVKGGYAIALCQEGTSGGQPINNGDYMANSTMVTVMGQIACYTGKATKWDDVYKSDVQFGPSPDESTFETDPPTLADETGNYPLPRPGSTKWVV